MFKPLKSFKKIRSGAECRIKTRESEFDNSHLTDNGINIFHQFFQFLVSLRIGLNFLSNVCPESMKREAL